MLPRLAMRPPWGAGISRNQWVLLVAVFISFIGFDFVAPFLPLFVKELGVSDVGEAARWAALVLAIGPLGATVCGPVWGLISDRIGRKTVLLCSLGGFAVLLALMTFVQDVWQLVVVRGSFGVFGGYVALSMAMITTDVPKERLAQVIALQQSAQILAMAVAPAIGGVLADHFGLRAAFLAAAVLCAAALAIVRLLYREPVGEARKGAQRPRVSLRAVLEIPGLAWALVIVFMVQLVERSFNLLLPLQVTLIARPSESVPLATGLIFSVGAMVAAVSATALGRMAGRWRIEWLLGASLGGGALLTLWMGTAGGTVELGLARMGHSLITGGALTLAYARASQRFPGTGRSTAFALLGSAAVLGSALSAPVAAIPAGISMWHSFLTIAMMYGLALGLVVASGMRQRRA